ncbi:MAG: lipoyl(octanoyl) transferase LipB [candidate division WOR-3 bacterium]
MVKGVRAANLILLDRIDYEAAVALQRLVWELRVKNEIEDSLILCEHPPVITLGRRADRRNLLATESELERRGIRVYQVERGGDITYHGPGQLLGYPIFKLESGLLGVRRFVELVESALIRALAEFGIRAETRPKLVGVWAGEKKIASLGIAVQEGVTFHGFALNIGSDLSGFELINPCGLSSWIMTSMEIELGQTVSRNQVVKAVISGFEQVFGLRFQTNLPRSLTSLTNFASSERIASA